MKTTKAQIKASRRWNEENLERIYITVKKGEKEKIKEAASHCGESVNKYILNAVESRMINV